MRQIVLDTETTGLSPQKGHRVVEIGCVELFNRRPTGNNFHVYVNPERDMPKEAFRVHGLSQAFLEQYPPSAEVASAFTDYVTGTEIIIHNANFDAGRSQVALSWFLFAFFHTRHTSSIRNKRWLLKERGAAITQLELNMRRTFAQAFGDKGNHHAV